MAFVNNKGEDEQRSERADSGQPIDFDPNDPDEVKVHYDLEAWNFDQRAELSEALAAAELPHTWDGDELVIPEAIEETVDALFERFDEELGPFPIVLADDEPFTTFDLDEWSLADRNTLSDSLIEAEIPHRWKGTTVLVAADAEHAVDDLLDAIEAGELLATGDGIEPPDGALGTMFVTADKLAKDPVDVEARAVCSTSPIRSTPPTRPTVWPRVLEVGGRRCPGDQRADRRRRSSRAMASTSRR